VFQFAQVLQAEVPKSQRIGLSAPLGNLLSVRWVVGGTLPSFDFALSLVAK
jgi:hypothetical protein